MVENLKMKKQTRCKIPKTLYDHMVRRIKQNTEQWQVSRRQFMIFYIR